MQGRFHLGLGLAAGLSVGVITSNGDAITAACTTISCCFGSIFPDIDSATSKMGQISKTTSFFIRLLFGHRGIIHTPLALILLDIPICILINKYQLPWGLLIGFSTGYVLHLIQDSFTKRGIKWLAPFSKTSYSIFPMKSGKHDFTEFIISAIIFLFVTSGSLLINYWVNGVTDYRIYFNFDQLSISHIVNTALTFIS